MKTIISLLIAVAWSSTAVLGQTQDYLFKVLASNGTTTLIKGGATDNENTLKPGSKLDKQDKVQISGNSFLALVHKTGKTLELKTPGTYVIAELNSTLSSSNTTVSQKYADFVIMQMTKEQKEDINKNRQKHEGTTGSVERDIAAAGVKVLLPPSSDVLDAKPVIKWHPVKGTQNYVVKVTNMFDEVLFTTTTADTSATLDLSAPKLKNEKECLIIVSSKEKPAFKSIQYRVNRLQGAQASNLNKSLLSLKDGAEDSSINKIIQASFFEENELYLDAMRSYEQAIEMQPDVEDYRIAYKQFLQRHHLEK